MSKHPAIFLLAFFFTSSLQAQQKQDSILTDATLEQCVQYALTHQPIINQSLIDEKIVDANVKTRLADWYPQVNFDYSLQYYFKVPRVSGGTATLLGTKNYSTAYFSF